MRKQVHFRLLIVRLGAMGDVLHALPAVTALRQTHPAWKIDWAIEPRWLPLLSSEMRPALFDPDRDSALSPARPVVDQIHLVPARSWGKRPFSTETRKGISSLRQALRLGDYDAVLDLQGSLKSALVAHLAGSRRILGEQNPRESPARWFFSERITPLHDHVIDQAAELAGAVCGDLLTPAQPLLPIDPDAESWCNELLEIRTWKPVVLVHPGGGWGAKQWPADRYGVVVEDFVSRGAVVLVNAGPGEEALAAKVVAAAGGSGTVVACTLPQLIALTRRISLAIGGDTGPLHLACALGKPVVGIYGPTDPKRNGPYGSRLRVLRNPESRTDHSRMQRTEAGLLTITPESVIEAAAAVLREDRKDQFTAHTPAPPGPIVSSQGTVLSANGEIVREPLVVEARRS